MYPDLFGIKNSSYAIMVVLGIIAAVVLLFLYLKRKNYPKNTIIDVIACTFFTVAIGIVGSILFQNLYDLIKDPSTYVFNFKMTFYGGLIAGAIAFVLIFNLYVKKHNDIKFGEIAIIAPACITSAHGLGRIGCFLAGCCYGKQTDSWIGVEFPDLGKRIPTQLIEAIFLFILTAVLLILIFKTNFKWTMLTYLASYSIFRFILEFYRGDEERGGTLLGLYPSQIICVLIWIMLIPLLIFFRKVIFKPEQKNEEK